MITLVCAKCGTTLRVDDGFAGGVCRCSRCGTIQTVPTVSDNGTQLTGSGTQRVAGQAIYERSGRAPDTDRDLAQLGEIVTSSSSFGSSIGGRGRRPRDPATDVEMLATLPPRAQWPIVLAVIAAALVAGGVGVGLWLGRSHESPEGAANGSTTTTTIEPTAALPTGPRFGTIPLTELAPVVYLVDADATTRRSLPAIRASVLRSAGTLRPPRKFQIRFVAPPGQAFAAFPASGPQQQTAQLLLEAGGWFDEAPPAKSVDGGDVAASMEAALALHPGEMVFVTGNAARLSNSFAERASAAFKRSPEVRLHALAIGTEDAASSLKPLVEQTRGRLVIVDSGSGLTDFARR